VIEFCRVGLATYKKPTTVRFLTDLPRTVSLKVRRSEVRKMLEAEVGARSR
jgi:acyl-coenzyme A synthetase/AMP-(fatty) acid ligase